MKKLLLGLLLVSSMPSFAEVKEEAVLNSQDEIREFLSSPHSYIYDLAITPYLVRNNSASDMVDTRVKEYLNDSYHLSRINTGSQIESIRINLKDFNQKDDDSRIFVHFEYTNDGNSRSNYHSKYATLASGRFFNTKYGREESAKIKDLEACKAYHNQHPLSCD